MKRETTTITPAQIAEQRAICAALAAENAAVTPPPRACVRTFGCQQNEADSERLRGYLSAMGYVLTEDADADVVLLNTCAIREHAEQRVLGHLGALSHALRKNPQQIIGLCGCMAQEERVAQQLKSSYPQVKLVFGPHALWRFPALLQQVRQDGKRRFDRADEPGAIAEGIPVVRKDGVKAWVSVMYGCNNFCSYCIVPYVRGRERSRAPAVILGEIRALVAEGYREITLLGQNVNSYGRDLDEKTDFADLLAAANDIPGEFLLRFMTSHPKDATGKLFQTMARCNKVAPCLHLPVQAGSDRVLAAMHRGYTRAHYLAQVAALRAQIPDVVLTSDIIVGFPGETMAEFEETLSLLEEVRYDALFTFIYSPRAGTPAALLPDPMDKAQKSANFQRLLDVQNGISAARHAAYVGKTLRCLIDGVAEPPHTGLTARTGGNRLVQITDGDPARIGTFAEIEIVGCSTWALRGVLPAVPAGR